MILCLQTGKEDDVVEAGVSKTEAIVAPVNEKEKKSVRRRVTFSEDTKNDDKKDPDVTLLRRERQARRFWLRLAIRCTILWRRLTKLNSRNYVL